MSDKLRYSYVADGQYEITDKYIFFNWILTSGVVDLEKQTLKYGSDKYFDTYSRIFRSSMNDIIKYFNSIKKNVNFKILMIGWFHERESDYEKFQ